MTPPRPPLVGPPLVWLSRGAASLPGHDSWLSNREREHAATLRFTKRRIEFLVARWTLKNAVTIYSGRSDDIASLAAVEARPAPTGAPVLYVDGSASRTALSMSDRAGWAVCLLGPGRTSIGVDVELVEPRSDAFVADWLTDAEQAVVARSDRSLTANLVWSAKESALKVMQTGLRRDTRSVEVTPTLDDEPDCWSPLTVRSHEGATFCGWWRRFGDFVMTLCADRALPPPRSLELPPALAAAVPEEPWLAAPTSKS